ncbi:hypothetical protein [Facklamia sp. P12934]|uniref:hypothetical protein n=1 Tax=unclassified Facklamia TaxID=2622293 RepID=UPI003D185465
MWKSFTINAQNIKVDTGKAVLIAMPKSSEFKGFSFWHPEKLIRDHGGKGYWKSLSYTETWEFKLFKYGKRRQILKELTATVEDMEKAFASSQVNNNSSDYYLEVSEPVKINARVEVDESLIKQ